MPQITVITGLFGQTYPVMPSLSRAPVFQTTRDLEDGTLRDPMESGYVATRPRFTRQRAKYSVTVKNLVAEDLRVLDIFERTVVQGGAGAFYLPNLAPNASFEFAGNPGQIFACWQASSWNQAATTVPAAVPYAVSRTAGTDGLWAACFSTVACALDAGAMYEGRLSAENTIPVATGDILSLAGVASVTNPTGAPTASLLGRLLVTYADGTTQSVDEVIASAATSGFTSFAASFTVPTHSAAAVSAAFVLVARLDNSAGTAAANITAAEISFAVDQLSLAVISAAQPYGRMPGTSPVAVPVRFTKLPNYKDTEWSGQDRFDVTFEVTEL